MKVYINYKQNNQQAVGSQGSLAVVQVIPWFNDLPWGSAQIKITEPFPHNPIQSLYIYHSIYLSIYHDDLSIILLYLSNYGTQFIGGGFPHNLVGKTLWWATEVLVCCKLI